MSQDRNQFYYDMDDELLLQMLDDLKAKSGEPLNERELMNYCYPNPALPEGDFDLSKAEGGRIFITEARHEGFDLINPRIAVLSMAEDEGRAVMAHRRRQRILRKSGGGGKRLMSHADLKEGDYVVRNIIASLPHS